MKHINKRTAFFLIGREDAELNIGGIHKYGKIYITA